MTSKRTAILEMQMGAVMVETGVALTIWTPQLLPLPEQDLHPNDHRKFEILVQVERGEHPTRPFTQEQMLVDYQMKHLR